MLRKDIINQDITIEGKKYLPDEIKHIMENKPSGFAKFHLEVLQFLNSWFDGTDEIYISTSGSTGKPSTLKVKKEKMINSAAISCDFFNLKSGDKCLLCLPVNFIAGKMLIVRALVAGLDLYPVEPSGHPLKNIENNFRFASVVPLQVYNSLQSEIESRRLKNIEILLIGGGSLETDLENKLKNFPNSVYLSYGMAETLSHIAMRRINGEGASKFYKPLPCVSVSLSDEGTIVINAPEVCEKALTTNDMGKINSDGSFSILGRKDNVIDTGGIKVQTETLEAEISSFFHGPFAISSAPDSKFGEIIVMVTESPVDTQILRNKLSPYQIPKLIIQVESIPRTESGKINRYELKKLCHAAYASKKKV